MGNFPHFGYVAEMGFARVFGVLATDRLTGVLRLEQDARNYAVYWREGDIVAADSSAPDDTLARIALEGGLLDAAAVGECIKQMAREPNKSQRKVLEEMGRLDTESLDRVARAALTRRALRVFSLPTARFVVDEKEVDRVDGAALEPRWALYQGLLQHYDERRLGREIAELDGKAFKLAADDGALNERYGFKDEERIVIAYLLKGYWEMVDLIEACMTLPRPKVLAVVLALHGGAELDVQPARSVQRLRKRAREATLQLPTRPSALLDLPITIEDAGTSEPKPRPAMPPPLAPQPAAHATPPSRPSAPLPIVGTSSSKETETIREQIMNKLSQVEGRADHFTLLEVKRNAGSTEIKAAYFTLARTYHPDRLVLHKLEALRPHVEKIFGRLSDAFAAIGEDAHRVEYLKVLAQGGEAAVKRREDDEVARATRVLTAEEHFRKGEMALRREMFVTAMQEFGAALELNDAEAEHHAMFAWSKWCCAEDKNAIFTEVKKGLMKAIELSDRCVAAFLHLGHVYSARGEHERAYNMYQKVLGLTENHVEANRQIRLIDMRRGKEKKGLFDRFKKKD